MSGAFSPPTHAPDCLMGMAGPDPAFFFKQKHNKRAPTEKNMGPARCA